MCQLIFHMQTNRINENIDHYWVTKALTIGIYHLNFPILISKNQLKLLYNASIFYYDAKLGVNVIMLEPLNQPFFFGRIYLCVCIYMIHIYIFVFFIYIYTPLLLFPANRHLLHFLFSFILWEIWNEYHELVPQLYFQSKKSLCHFNVIAKKSEYIKRCYNLNFSFSFLLTQRKLVSNGYMFSL